MRADISEVREQFCCGKGTVTFLLPQYHKHGKMHTTLMVLKRKRINDNENDKENSLPPAPPSRRGDRKRKRKTKMVYLHINLGDGDELIDNGVNGDAGRGMDVELSRYVATMGGNGVDRETEAVGNLFV